MRVFAAGVVRDSGFVPVPHISARRLKSEHQLEEFLATLNEVGAAESVFVVVGDPIRPEGPYTDSYDLIGAGLLAKHGVKHGVSQATPNATPISPTSSSGARLKVNRCC